MKTNCLIALGLCAAFTAAAQPDVVKEAERALKADKDAAEVVAIITPAFTDPTTATQANTWFVPGKAAYKQYDHLLGLRSLNKLPEGGLNTMGQLLVDGYNYYAKALPLDSVADKKGVVKTSKITKEIGNTVIGHASDYFDRGVDLFNAQDYMGAYKLWTAFCDIPNHPVYVEVYGKTMPADTVFGEVAYNKAIAAWQADSETTPMKQNVMEAFRQAKKFGYTKKQLFDNAISMALQLNATDDLLAFAKEGRELYGQEDNSYLAQIVNYYLTNKNFDEAFKIINEAIAETPDAAQYFVIRGVLYENTEDLAKAMEDYRHATELDAANAQAMAYYGRMLTAEADRLNNEAPTLQSEYEVYYENTLLPKYKEAAEVLEKAYTLDTDNKYNRDTLNILENIYFIIKDSRYDDVQNRKKLL